MNLDDGCAVGTSSASSSVSARGRVLRYLVLGVLTALVAGGVASWVRSRSKTEHWQSAPTGWNTHTPATTPFATTSFPTTPVETTEPEPETIEPEAIEPETIEPETIEPEVVAARAAPETAEPPVVDVTAVDSTADGAETPDRSDLRG